MSYNDLPYIRDIVDVRDDCRPTCKCPEAKCHEEKVIEDRRLANWNRWMEERRAENKTLGEALKRRPGELLMNYSEDLRPIKEEKLVFEHAKIPHPHDYYRGNPAFWRMPVALSSECKNKQSYYFKAMTKDEQCEIPEMEYVDVPNAIRHEKDTWAVGYRNPKELWDKSTYRQERTTSLQAELKHVEPYKPTLQNLFIKGTALKNAPKRTTSKHRTWERVKIMEETSDEVAELNYLEANGIKLSPNSPATVYMYFEYDLNSKGVLTKILTIKNLSLTTMRFHFHKVKKHNLFSDIIDDVDHDILFYFQKNVLVILPESTEEIPIHFKIDVPVTFKQCWEFHTCPLDIKMMLHLQAVATFWDLEDRCEKIKRELDENVRNNVSRRTIDHILSKIPMPQGNTVIYTYDKAMIFEAVNQDYNPIVSRPKYLYNKSVVKQLEEFYDKVKLPCHDEIWNYNVEDLKVVTKQRERFNFGHRIVDEIQSAKMADKHMKDAEESGTKSNETDKVTINEVTGAQETRLYSQLEDLLVNLERPSVWVNLNQNKYAWSYVILCTHVDAMCRDAQNIQIDWGINQTSTFPVLKDPVGIRSERKQFEYLDDVAPPHSKIVSYDFDKADRPAKESLKDVPIDDSLKRYRVFYDIPEDEPKTQDKKSKGKRGDKRDKKGGKGDKKGAKGDKKSKKTKTDKSKKGEATKPPETSQPLFQVVDDFDPYEEIDVPSIDEEPTQTTPIETTETDQTNERMMRQYRLDLYLIFYKHLENAVCRIADVCEHQKHRRLKLGVFKRILESTEATVRPVRVQAIDLRAVIETCMNPKKLSSKDQAKKQRDEMIQKWRNEITEEGDVEKKASLKKHRRTDRWISEVVQPKEPDSLWSILQAPKKQWPSDKPISYPVSRVRKKPNTRKKILEDFGNVMSNAGIDPNWEDFKEMGVQTLPEVESKRDVELSMENIIDEALRKVYELGRGEAPPNSDENSSEDERFYDEIVPVAI